VSEAARHNLFRVFLYSGIFLIVAYFFNDIMESNKKIIYTEKEMLFSIKIKKAVLLEGEQKLLVESDKGQLYIVDANKSWVESSKIEYSNENKTADEITRYILSGLLFVLVILLSVT